MQTIKKVLNSSVVLVEDDEGVERVLLGKGIGFGAKAGQKVSADSVDRVFVEFDLRDRQSFAELASQVPGQFVELAQAIIQDAQGAGLDLDPHIYLTLTGHLHFAVERHRRNLRVVNRLAWEMRMVYPDEYAIGVRGVELLRKSTGRGLPDEEAANIAFHLVDASVSRVGTGVNAIDVAQLVSQISTIVSGAAGVSFSGDDLHSRRFFIHLQFFAERLFSGTSLPSSVGDSLFNAMSAQHPKALAVAERVRLFISSRYDKEISNEEVGYLAIHIARALEG